MGNINLSGFYIVLYNGAYTKTLVSYYLDIWIIFRFDIQIDILYVFRIRTSTVVNNLKLFFT